MADWRAEARKAALRHGIRPEIFLRQIQQESGFNPHARSPAGALGIAQIMPATAKGWGVDPLNPKQALNAAAKNMARYVDQFGNYEDALRAYNAGPGNVKASRGFAETNHYVQTILRGTSDHASGSEASTGDMRIGSRTRTIPGIDNSAARAAVQAQIGQSAAQLLQPGSDVLDFAVQQGALRNQLKSLQDTPSRTVSVPGAPGSSRSTGSNSSTGGGSRGKSPLLEEIYNTGTGPGFAVKNGKEVSGPGVYGAVWEGHRDHVHLAAGKKTVVELGKQAQKMGLHVGENPNFGGVGGSHVPGSYHYKGQAIDVSGDSRKLRQFARWVQRQYGLNPQD